MKLSEKERPKKNRQTSVITIILFLFLVIVMSAITLNSVSEMLSYEEDKFVVKIEISGIDDITEEMETKFENLSVEVRDRYTDEQISKLTFIEKSENGYIYQSDKTEKELEYNKLFVRLEDIEEYTLIGDYQKNTEATDSYYDYKNMIYNNFNLDMNQWEHCEIIDWPFVSYLDTPTISLNYRKNVSDNIVEKRLSFSEVLNTNIPKELYENIIIFHKGKKFVFDRIEGEDYIYKGKNEEVLYDSDEYDIYLPNVLKTSVRANIDEKQYVGVVWSGGATEIWGKFININYQILGKEISSGNTIILQRSDENAGTYKEVNWINDNDAILKFSYMAFTCLTNNRVTIQNETNERYITENGKNNGDFRIYVDEEIEYGKSLILFKETLPQNFKISDEYLNDERWVILDDVSDENYKFPTEDHFTDTKDWGISKEVIDALMEINYYGNITYSGKKFVYVRSSNTIYYLVDMIDVYGEQEINIEYIGDDKLDQEYFSNNDVEAYYVIISTTVYHASEAGAPPETKINEYEEPSGIDIIKKWEDNNNEAGKRPESITIQIKKEETVVKEIELSEANDWKKTVVLPEYEYQLVIDTDKTDLGETVEKKKIDYTIDEVDIENLFYQKENIEGFVITNKFIIPEDRIKITGTKVWDDHDNENQKRPSSIILQVKNKDIVVTEAEVSEENNWSYEFELPKYDENGNEIKYTIDEKETSEFYEKELTNDTTVTNKYTTKNESIELVVNKEWKDENNRYGKRPESVILQVKNGENIVAEVKVGQESNWSYKFELPKYDENGDEIVYTIDEKESSKFYEKTIDGYTIINTYKNEPPVETSDKNIWIYFVIFLIAIVGVVVGIFIVKNNKKTI
ncbi:MAG: Cna B-type domain-containing protein [Clostridia bacterium]|nr:Cna B-type domain-containing protein [Clostridia bacterium]